MTKHISIAAAVAFVGLGTGAVRAEEVVIKRDAPTTVIERREAPVGERRTIETTGSVRDCASKTVTKENEFGDRKTVRKESCD